MTKFTPNRIKELLSQGEDSETEFKIITFAGKKPKDRLRDDLTDEIVAFANAEGGVLLCNVSDDGEVQEMSQGQQKGFNSMFTELSTDSIKPPVRIKTYHRKVDDKLLLVVEIPRGEYQHEGPGGASIRVGNTKRKLEGDEKERHAQKRRQARFHSYDECTIPNTGFESLEESLWKPLLSTEGASDPENGLFKLALLAPDDEGVLRVTVAGALLCTPSPEQFIRNAYITAAYYRGLDQTSEQIDAQEITGPLNRQIESAMVFIMRNMKVSAKKTPARSESPQYSKRALFEALVNAVVHRDYSIRGSKIRVLMFADRIEIRSPGSLPNNVTLENMPKRQATRNEVLASVLGTIPVKGIQGSENRAYFIEKRGDGVRIIEKETHALSGKKPERHLIDNAEFYWTLPAAVLEESPAEVTVTVWCKGQAIPGVNLLLLFPNKTWKKGTTDMDGGVVFDLYTTHLPMTVFVAALGYSGCLVRSWIPSTGALTVELEELTGGGSAIFEEATGYLPGLKGRLNPIRDSHDRTYLRASNIAINRGKQEPVHFVLGQEELQLTDVDGHELWVRVIDIVGRSALIEYKTKDNPASSRSLTDIIKQQWKRRLLPRGNEFRMLKGHKDSVWSVSFSPDGSVLASGSDDSTIRLWDVATGEPLSTLEGHEGSVWSVSFSPDGSVLASGGGDKTIRLWDLATGETLSTLKEHSDSVLSVSFSPDGRVLASCSDDKTIRLWDVTTGEPLSKLKGHKYGVHSVLFSPDGRVLASCSDDKTIRLWDVTTGGPISTLEGHDGGVRSISFSPDGRVLASCSGDRTILLWDIATGETLSTLEGHKGENGVWSVSFSPDGRMLASSGNNIRLWDVATCALLRTLKEHEYGVWSVSFSPDGRVLASCSRDKTIRLWDVSTHVSTEQGSNYPFTKR